MRTSSIPLEDIEVGYRDLINGDTATTLQNAMIVQK
jgi:hypothetical protein